MISYMNQRYMIFGETLDIAVGNCLDRFDISCSFKISSFLYGMKNMLVKFSNSFQVLLLVFRRLCSKLQSKIILPEGLRGY